MGYSSDALTLRKPGLVELPRSGDRISFLYIDRAKVWQDETGVVAQNERGEKFRIPVASLAVLFLGNGTSLTAPAMTSLYRAGCSVITTADGGVTGLAGGRPLAARARWAEAQARMWATAGGRETAARQIYRARFPEADWDAHSTLRSMRGLEGHLTKAIYRQGAAKHRMRGWKRNTDGDDPVNQLLNLANSILYGSALAAVTAVGLNPALGIVHQGSTGALLFDLADAHKTRSSIPLAFACASHPDPPGHLRRRMREYLHRTKALEEHLTTLDQALGPHFTADAGDRLLDDQGTAPGHTNYAHEHEEI